MAAILKKHKFTLIAGGTPLFFLANPLTYTGLGTETGVTEATSAEQGAPTYSVQQLLVNGTLHRVILRYVVGTTKKTAKLLVPRDKLTGMLALSTGTYRGGTILSCNIPSKTTFF